MNIESILQFINVNIQFNNKYKLPILSVAVIVIHLK